MSMGSVERAVFPALFCVLAGRARPATGAMVACPSAGRPGCFELKKNITLEVQAEVARKQGDRRGEGEPMTFKSPTANGRQLRLPTERVLAGERAREYEYIHFIHGISFIRAYRTR